MRAGWRGLFAPATLLIGAAIISFVVIARSAAGERDVELVDDELLRLQSFSTSIHKFGELGGAESREEVLAELAELRRAAGGLPGWSGWVADLQPIVLGRLDVSGSKARRLDDEIDRRLDALEEDALSLQQDRRRRSHERALASSVLFAVIVALSLLLLWASFRTLDRETEAHRETAEKFSKAFYGSSMPMAIGRGPACVLIEVNGSLERLLGAGQSELIGRSIDDIGLRVGGRLPSEALGGIAELGALIDAEAQLTGRDGDSRHLLMSAHELKLGGASCAFACFHDITERKRAEAALRDFSGALVRAEQRERRRLSQILHDNLQQTLSAAAMHINLVRRDAGGESRQSAEAAAGILKEAVQTTRALSYELCPPDIARGSLGRSLQWLGEQMRQRHKLDVSVVIAQDPPGLPDFVRDFCLGATRELLFNVVKHAKTAAATVVVSSSDGHLRVEVSDHGEGFDAAKARAVNDGLGLADIRERVALFGGRLELESRPHGGCRVALMLPLEDPPVREVPARS